MGKHEDLTGNAAVAAPSAATAVPSAISAEPAASDTIDLFGIAAPKIERPRIESPSLVPPVETLRIDPVERAMHDGIKSARAAAAATVPDKSADAASGPAKESAASAPQNRFLMLAASLALAAGLGAMIGALGAFAIAPAQPERTAASPSNGSRALRDAIAQIRTDVAALKSSVDSAARNSNAQFAKVGERFNRVEQAQTEPAARLAKVIQTLERLDRREPASPVTTGTVTPPPAAAAPLPQPKPSPSPVQGWFVRDVYDGAALLEGRRGELVEVSPGDMVPGLGRVEAIRRQDGRWVVVTQRGLITAAPR